MADQALFKSQTFGGFKKEEVLSYIDKLNSDHSAELEQLQNDLNTINEELNDKNQQIVEKDNSFNELLGTYEELRQHYLLLKERTDNLEYENNKLKELNDEAERKLAEEKEYSKKLKEKNMDASVSLDQIGDSAKMIVNSAKDSAHEIITDAQKKASNYNFEIDKIKEDLANTKVIVENSLTALLKHVELLSEQNEKYKNIDHKEHYESIVQEKYDKAVATINNKIKSFKDSFFH